MSEEPLICYVEVPRGSRNKYEFDEDLGAIKLDRFLFSSIVYPTDYGYLLQTLGEDGDPLDAMVCVSEPTFPGCMIEVKPIALFKMKDEEGVDDTILCVPCEDPAWNNYGGLDDVPGQLRNEISHFFDVYKDLEPGKESSVEGWYPRDDAIEEIEASRRRYRDNAG